METSSTRKQTTCVLLHSHVWTQEPMTSFYVLPLLGPHRAASSQHGRPWNPQKNPSMTSSLTLKTESPPVP